MIFYMVIISLMELTAEISGILTYSKLSGRRMFIRIVLQRDFYSNVLNKHTSKLSVSKSLEYLPSNYTTRWDETPELPALNHRQFRQVLDKYVNEFPKRHVLMVYGAKSVGKSRVIMEKSKSWSENGGRLVLDVDLKGICVTPEELVKLFIEKYLHFRFKNEPIASIKRDLNSTISLFLTGSEMFSPYITKISTFFPDLETTNDAKIKLNEFSGAIRLFTDIATTITRAWKESENEGEESINKRFIMFLNTLENEMDKKPIIIIREVQKLVDSSSSLDIKYMFESLFTCFEQYKQGTRNVSVIIESSEYLWSDLMRHIKSSPESFSEYQVQPWSKEEGFEETVNTYKIFTAEEYEKIWTAVGGHAGQLFDLHCYLRRGFTLDEAIAAKNRASVNSLISIIKGRDGDDYIELLETENKTSALTTVMSTRRSFLRHLKESGYVLIDSECEDSHYLTIDYLFKSNVLWVDKGVIAPIHQAMQNAIDFYIK